MRVSTNAPPSSSTSSSSNFEFQQMAAALEDKMTLTFRNEMNEMKNMMKALVPTPVPIKAVEERCTTCGSNHSFNVCPMTRGGYEYPVYHDNFQQFQQTASVGNFVQNGNAGYRTPNLANQIRPPDTHNHTHPPGFSSNQSKPSNQGNIPHQGMVPYQSPPQNSQVVLASQLDTFKKTTEGNRLEPIRLENLTSGSFYTSGATNSPPYLREMESLTGKGNRAFFGSSYNSPHAKETFKETHLPYPQRMKAQKQKEKMLCQLHKFLEMFQKLHFNISLAEALVLMPKYTQMMKALLSNKEKLLEAANTPLTENCSAVIMKKLPEKLGDPGRFLIPCDFTKMSKCMALADLGASINLMPFGFYQKLKLPELVTTKMTLELANGSLAIPTGIAEDVLVKVGHFSFPADFVVVDYEVNYRVPLILGRPFLRTARVLYDVHGEELVIRDGMEMIVFKPDGSQDKESIHMMHPPQTFMQRSVPHDVCEPESDDSSSPTSTIVEELFIHLKGLTNEFVKDNDEINHEVFKSDNENDLGVHDNEEEEIAFLDGLLEDENFFEMNDKKVESLERKTKEDFEIAHSLNL
ncbi:reverse transcriptase domain-containing protein [Tanacetum coccineum]